MDFQKRLEKAIERGQRAGDARAEAETRKRLDEQELRRLHTQYRLDLSEHIERCLRQVPDQLPGFDFESVASERGWGAAVSRDDITGGRKAPVSRQFSRMEIVIRPINEYFLLDMSAKATVRNRERFHRNHYQQLSEVDIRSFLELIDLWILEFAEAYASAG
jgi:hypothetical protein